MTDRYCSVADLYQFGVPRGALPNPARKAASALASSDVLTLYDHGFQDGDQVTFRAEAGGSLPSGISAATTYYVRDATSESFQVAATSGGAAIDLTTDGSGVLVIASLPKEAAIDWASRVVDDMLPTAVIPLESPYPEIVRLTTAELAAGKLLQMQGKTSSTIMQMIDFAHKRLERWSKGATIHGTSKPDHANYAVSATAPYKDRRGWTEYGGL